MEGGILSAVGYCLEQSMAFQIAQNRLQPKYLTSLHIVSNIPKLSLSSVAIIIELREIELRKGQDELNLYSYFYTRLTPGVANLIIHGSTNISKPVSRNTNQFIMKTNWRYHQKKKKDNSTWSFFFSFFLFGASYKLRHEGEKAMEKKERNI